MTLKQYRFEDVTPGDIGRDLARPDGRVQIEVPLWHGERPLHVGGIAKGAILEIFWTQDDGRVDGAFVRIEGGAKETDQQGILRITVSGGFAREVTIDGAVDLAELRIGRARVHLTGVGEQRVERLVLDRLASVHGCRMCGTNIEATEANGVVTQRDGEVAISRARSIRMTAPKGISGPIVTVRDASGCLFEGLRLRLPPGARLVECRGSVRLVSCTAAFVIGAADAPLTVGAAFEDDGQPEDEVLRNSVLMGVKLESATLTAFLGAAAQASVMDPAPASVRSTLLCVPESIREGVAEMMLQRLSEKATRPQAVDIAASVVLEMRRRRIDRWTLDWLLLHAFRVLGYGRLVGPPLAVWAGMAIAIVLARLVQAVDEPSGALSPAGLADGAELTAMAYYAGNVLLTIVFLPLSWIRAGSTAELVGLAGGYLVAARVLLAVPLVFAIGAARSRLRVRPAALTH